MTVDANRVSDALPDDIRVPLHELQADMDYLFGRAAADSSTAGGMSQSVKAKLTALETALTEALRRSPSLSGGEGEVVAWECVDANGDVHITRSRAEMETWDQTDVFVRPLYPHPKEAEVTDSDLLAAMKKHVGWELDWGPEDRHDEESDFGWRVFERSGGRSDLEWTLLGFGESPRAALVAALSRKG